MYTARSIVCAALLAVAAGAPAQEGGDVQARILYAYQTEDSNALSDLVQSLVTQVKDNGSDSALRYHLAHAHYRLGLVAVEHHARHADEPFVACIDDLKPVIEQDVKTESDISTPPTPAQNANTAEAYTLQSACYAQLADQKMLEAVLLRTRAADRLKEAMRLAPRNPRVALIAATELLSHSKPKSADRQKAFDGLQTAVTLFDNSSGTNIDTPGWGHAEAYLALGRELQLRGDRIGARNWIEKSLLAAPDFKAAQRQLSQLGR